MNVAVPHSTFYLFPDVTEAMHRMGYTAVADIREGLGRLNEWISAV